MSAHSSAAHCSAAHPSPTRTSPSRTAAVAAACALLLALAACTVPGGGEPGNSGAASAGGDSPDELAGPVLSSCVDGDWSADLDDLARQLGDTLAGNGMSVTATSAAGVQEVAIGGEGAIGFSSDATLTVTVAMSDGLAMTVTQQHLGTMAAEWAWDGSAAASDSRGTMLFENFDTASYAIHNSTEAGGQVSETDIPVSSVGYGDVPMLVTCAGDTMTTQAQGSPFTTTWRRA